MEHKLVPPKHNPSSLADLGSILKTNQVYLAWQKSYQLILNILFSSPTKSVIAHVVSAGTSKELWLMLESMFSSHFQAKEFQVRF